MGDVIKFRPKKQPKRAVGPFRGTDGTLLYQAGSPWRKQAQRLERKAKAAEKAHLAATLARLDGSLMTPGAKWDTNLQTLGREGLYDLIAQWIVAEFNIDRESAADIAPLAQFVNIEWLCLPVSDPHRTVAQEYADGVLTLAEVHGFLTDGGTPCGLGGVRVAGLPDDYTVELLPRFTMGDDGECNFKPARSEWASQMPGWFRASIKLAEMRKRG